MLLQGKIIPMFLPIFIPDIRIKFLEDEKCYRFLFYPSNNTLPSQLFRSLILIVMENRL